eukprot:4980879-Pleurochrysis_carterae.AAC.4
MLLRTIGSDAHILGLDMQPTMWPIALACCFEQAAASPAAVIDGTLKLIIEGVREEKPTSIRGSTFSSS